MKKLRLLVTSYCDRACPGCCNNDYDLEALPECISFQGYDEIIFTGGEPMLYPGLLQSLVLQARKVNPEAKLILYTARRPFGPSDFIEKLEIYLLFDSITLTLHNETDVEAFNRFNWMIPTIIEKRCRLNVFAEAVRSERLINFTEWEVKPNLAWKKDCPLPEGEVFMKYGKGLLR